MDIRASEFHLRLIGRFDIDVIHRVGGRVGAVARMFRRLVQFRPEICYVFDMAAAGVTAAGSYRRATSTPFIVDTGDAIVELGKALGRGRLAMCATRRLEAYALRRAAAVVVRGEFHQKLLEKRGIRAEFIPDGVDVEQFCYASGTGSDHDDRCLSHVRSRGPSAPLVIGLVGSSVWVPGRGTCYGWELVELVRLLANGCSRQLRGVLIGDGTGIDVLRKRAAEYGVADRIDFAGRIPYNQLPARLLEFDIALSTQTNDVIGNVRTTGKLPLYLAAGRFVLASRVGQAARMLPPEMLVDFDGENDPRYPEKLAARVRDLISRRVALSPRPECVAIARTHFEYDMLAERLAWLLDNILAEQPQEPKHSTETPQLTKSGSVTRGGEQLAEWQLKAR